MKKTFWLIFAVLIPLAASAQYKELAKTPEMREAIAAPANIVLGFLNPEKLTMRHSFSSSFMSGGGGSMMLNAYMNSITYQFNEKLWLDLDLGIMNSPHNTYFKNIPALNQQNQTRFFGGGELNYRPSENTNVSLGIYSLPGYYQPGYQNPGYYYSPFYQQRRNTP